MRGADVGAIVQRLRADDGEDHALAVPVAVDAVAGFQLHARNEGLEALLLRLSDRPIDCLALNLAGADKVDILLAVRLHCGKIGIRNAVVAVFRRREQLLAQSFIFLFFHGIKNSFQKLLTFLGKCLGSAVVLQRMLCHGGEFHVRFLRIEAALGVIAGDTVALHQALDARFSRRGHGDGSITKLCQAAFKEGNGINDRIGCLGRMEQAQHLTADDLVCDLVEGAQGGFVGENQLA